MELLVQPDITKILIADDSKVVQKRISNLIKDSFVDVAIKTVSRLDDIDQALRDDQFNFLLLDILFPEGSALDKISEFREKYPHLFICTMSAQDDIRVALQTLELGSNFYLVKDDGFNSDLTNAINFFKSKQQSRQQLSKLVEEVFNPIQFPTAMIKASDIGSTVVYRDFESFPEEIGSVDAFLEKISISLLISLGQGTSYHTGIYKFPAGDAKMFSLYDFAFRLPDPDTRDWRLGMGYFHYLVFVPKSLEKMIPSIKDLEQILAGIEDIFSDSTDINEINMKLLKEVIFSRIREYMYYNG